MAYVSINDEYLKDISNAIRSRSNIDVTYRPKDMPEAIENLSDDALIVRNYLTDILTTYTNNKITSIREYGFAGRDMLESATFENVVEVGDSAFTECLGLKTVSLPNATKIGSFAFSSCGLKTISAPKLTEISAGLFCNSKLTTFDLPNITSIGSRAFEGADFEIADFPNITFVDSDSFNNMPYLEKIRLPDVVSMGDYNFNYCNRFYALILPGDTIPSIVPKFSSTGAQAGLFLDGTEIKAGVYIYVPSNKVSAYQSHSYWSKYSNRIRAIENYPDIMEGF